MGSDLLIHALTTLRFKQSDRISWAFGYRVISFDYEENEDRPLEYKKFGYVTQVMGASFRKTSQVLDLAGCDLLTISPELLENLQNTTGDVPRRLDKDAARAAKIERIALDESAFRWLHNDDAMATEKLAEGIRAFDADARKLANRVEELAAAA